MIQFFQVTYLQASVLLATAGLLHCVAEAGIRILALQLLVDALDGLRPVRRLTRRRFALT